MNKYLVIILSVVVLVVLFIKTFIIDNYVNKSQKIEKLVEEFQSKLKKIKKIIQENFTTTITGNNCIYTENYNTLLSQLNGTGGLIEQLNTIADDITLAFPPSDSDLEEYYNEFLGDGVTPTPLGSITDLRNKINSWIQTEKCEDKCGLNQVYNTTGNHCECDVEFYYNSSTSSANCFQRYLKISQIKFNRNYNMFLVKTPTTEMVTTSDNLSTGMKIIINYSYYDNAKSLNMYTLSYDQDNNRSLIFHDVNTSKRWLKISDITPDPSSVVYFSADTDRDSGSLVTLTPHSETIDGNAVFVLIGNTPVVILESDPGYKEYSRKNWMKFYNDCLPVIP